MGIYGKFMVILNELSIKKVTEHDLWPLYHGKGTMGEFYKDNKNSNDSFKLCDHLGMYMVVEYFKFLECSKYLVQYNY